MTKETSNRLSPEARRRAARMVLEHGGGHGSRWAAVGPTAAKIGCTAETPRTRVRQAGRDQGRRLGLTTEERERIEALERGVRGLRRANELLGEGVGALRMAECADRSHERSHRPSPGGAQGCADTRGAAGRPVDLPRPCRAPCRPGQGLAPRPAGLGAHERIRRVHAADSGVYGARKIRRRLGREGTAVARCTVERPMRRMDLRCVVRGEETRTTVPGKATPCPADTLNRRFRAPHPNVLWVLGFTCVATRWAFVYVALVIDALARRIFGWRVSRAANAGFLLESVGDMPPAEAEARY